MDRVFTLILLAVAATASWSAAPAKKPKTTTAATAKSAHKATQAISSHTAAHSVAKAHNGSVAKVKYVRRHGKLVRVVARATPAPSYQLHPDAERYQQIQQKLADKGYFKGEVNGQWGDDSVDALKRFQADQKLDNDGHLNALTLIGLGLGPKHDHDVATPGTTVAPILPGNSAPKTGPAAPLTPAANAVPAAGPPPEAIGKI